MKSLMSCCAIIITFYPGDDITENIAVLSDQVDEIVIVDNGSGDAFDGLFGSLARLPKVSIIFNQENLGIAAALNIGVKKAKTNNYQWVITFDQDSQASPYMIETMIKAYDAYPQKEIVASLSPKLMTKSNEHILNSHLISTSCEELPYSEVQVVITSGNLLKLSVFDTVGYFNETLFIDYVDAEYCLRCITDGYRILEVEGAVLLHDIGFPTQHRLLWKTPTAMNHNALRRYYITRNAIYTFKKFILKQPVFVITNTVGLLKNFVTMVLFESDRNKKLAATYRGFIDGLFGKMGKCKISF